MKGNKSKLDGPALCNNEGSCDYCVFSKDGDVFVCIYPETKDMVIEGKEYCRIESYSMFSCPKHLVESISAVAGHMTDGDE